MNDDDVLKRQAKKRRHIRLKGSRRLMELYHEEVFSDHMIYVNRDFHVVPQEVKYGYVKGRAM